MGGLTPIWAGNQAELGNKNMQVSMTSEKYLSPLNGINVAFFQSHVHKLIKRVQTMEVELDFHFPE